jgi:DNA-binding winged helix-turn-helix (wHTH) protein
MTAPQPHIFEFDDVRMDAGQRLLQRKGETVPLTPKVFDPLLCLVENTGRVIEKDDLIGAIWPNTAVEENDLNQDISTLRREADDSSERLGRSLDVQDCGSPEPVLPVVPATHSRGMV